MFFQIAFYFVACALVSARAFAPVHAHTFDARTDVTLANGTSMQYGTLATNGLEWQASG